MRNKKQTRVTDTKIVLIKIKLHKNSLFLYESKKIVAAIQCCWAC